jgi:uncharacterized protein with NRDE domain
MCTLILLNRPDHEWPILIAANRDERANRAWDAPAAWWPDFPGVIGGRDRSAGGSWMALGPHGVLAAALNRPGSLGPAPGKRSRGELPLLAASTANAEAAAEAITRLDAGAWRPFNLVVADHQSAFYIEALGEGRPRAAAMAPGISMVTSHPPNDESHPRTQRHLPRFRAAAAPEPARDDWRAWEERLADDSHEGDIAATLKVPLQAGYGTVSASLLGFNAAGERLWRFCAAPPGEGVFQRLALAPSA